MNIHKRFDTKEAYTEYFMTLINWARDSGLSLWNPEDYPLLQPFFNAQQNGEWTDEVKASFDLYQKCCADYADERKEIRDSVKEFNEYDLCEAFGFTYDEGDPEDDEVEPVITINDELTFPLIVTGAIECGFDRGGNYQYCCIRIVEAKEFN